MTGHQAQVTSALRCKMIVLILKLENKMWRLQLALPRACIPHGMAITRCISDLCSCFECHDVLQQVKVSCFLACNLSQREGRFICQTRIALACFVSILPCGCLHMLLSAVSVLPCLFSLLKGVLTAVDEQAVIEQLMVEWGFNDWATAESFYRVQQRMQNQQNCVKRRQKLQVWNDVATQQPQPDMQLCWLP